MGTLVAKIIETPKLQRPLQEEAVTTTARKPAEFMQATPMAMTAQPSMVEALQTVSHKVTTPPATYGGSDGAEGSDYSVFKLSVLLFVSMGVASFCYKRQFGGNQ